MFRCRGRIPGHNPIFLPTKATFTTKLTESAHLRMLHGGVGYTMAEIRKDYWIPRLRQLTKKIILYVMAANDSALHHVQLHLRAICQRPVLLEVDLFKSQVSIMLVRYFTRKLRKLRGSHIFCCTAVVCQELYTLICFQILLWWS